MLKEIKRNTEIKRFLWKSFVFANGIYYYIPEDQEVAEEEKAAIVVEKWPFDVTFTPFQPLWAQLSKVKEAIEHGGLTIKTFKLSEIAHLINPESPQLAMNVLVAAPSTTIVDNVGSGGTISDTLVAIASPQSTVSSVIDSQADSSVKSLEVVLNYSGQLEYNPFIMHFWTRAKIKIVKMGKRRKLETFEVISLEDEDSKTAPRDGVVASGYYFDSSCRNVLATPDSKLNDEVYCFKVGHQLLWRDAS